MELGRRGSWLGAAMIVATSSVVVGCEDANNSGGLFTPQVSGPSFDAGSNDATTTLGDPVAEFPGASIDVGQGDCGGAAVSKTVEFTNTGKKTLTLDIATNAPFSVSPSSLNVAPGEKGSLTVTVSVPQTATAGAAISGSIVVTTNDPAKPKVSIPLSVTAAGATLAFAPGSPTNADFGTGKLGTKDADVTVTVKNVGNKAATFTFGAPADTQFSIGSAPASPATLAPEASATLTASFTPNKLMPSTSASNITVAGPVCGQSLSKIEVVGQGTVGNVTGWPQAALDFGASPCGGASAAAKTFTLTNAGTADTTITAVTVGAKGYSVNVTPGTKVPKAGTLDITVTPPAIPTPSAVPGDYGDTLTITTDLPNDAPHSIPLTLAASGVILEFDTSATANFGSFGKIPLNTTATQQLAVKNTGNATASVTASASGGPFSISTGGAFTVGAGASVAFDTMFAPPNIQPQTGSLSVTTTGLCQPLPAPLPLSGQGTNGGIAISDTNLSFSANCGSTAPPKTFTITNTGNAPMTWTAKLGRTVAPPFAISPAGSTLAAGAIATVTVTPSAIPQYPTSIAPSVYADIVTISTDIVGDSDHLVSLQETPTGAVLSFDQPNLDFGDVPVNTSSPAQTLKIVNSGNPGSTANVTVSSSSALYVVNTENGTSASGAPAAPFTTSVTFNPGANPVASNAKISIQTNAALCAPLPPPIDALGRGTLAQVSFGPTEIDFGLVNCGAKATPQTVTFSNPGNQDYTLSAALLKKTHYSITLSPASGVVPKNNGGAVVITITPAAIPQTVPSVPDNATYSDELTVTTTAANDSPHTISIHQGAKGVILQPLVEKTWDFGTINYGATGFFNQSLRNAGNVDVSVSMADLTLPEFGFNPVTVFASTSVSIKGSFTPSASSGSWSDGAKLVVPGGTVLCQPLPNYDITLTGKGGDGSVITTSGNLTFPAVDCNAPANPAQSITIHNNGNTPASWTAGFNDGQWYSIVGPTSGTIPAFGGSVAIPVQPKTIVSGPNTFSGSNYNDQLIVTVSGITYSFPISEVAVGADITSWFSEDKFASDGTEYQSGDYSFFTANGYYQDTAHFSVHNSGNRTVTLSSTFSPSYGWSAPTTSVPPNGGDSSTSHEWRYGGTDPTATCGITHTAKALPQITGPVCYNALKSVEVSVQSYLNRCEQPVGR